MTDTTDTATATDHCDLCGCEMKHPRTGTPGLLACEACRDEAFATDFTHLEMGIAK